MGKKILIVGGVAGGASAAARARRLDESAEIVIFEKGPHVSFSNCSLPFHLSGVVEKSEQLVLMTPADFQAKYNIEARTRHEVLKINRIRKTLTVKNLENGEEYEETYDALILAPGARPVLPKIEGIDLSHVFTVRNVNDIDSLRQFIQRNGIREVGVIGGGFIGIEVAENLRLAGLDVTLIEAGRQVMAPLDEDMVQILHKELVDHGVNLILNDGVKTILPNAIKLQSGKQILVRAVVMAVGVQQETRLAADAGLAIGKTGGIQVNANYQTSDQHIYAVGDAIEVTHRITRRKTGLAMAGPAQRQARTAVNHIYGIPGRNKGVIGTSVIRVFDLNVAVTGINEKTAKQAGIDVDFAYVIPPDKVGLMPDSHPLHFKLLFEVPTGKILGAQAVGKGNVDKRIDVIATMIMMDGTLEDLQELELCYSPLFGTPRDVVNQAALVGLNLLNGIYRQVPVTKVRELVENGAVMIDVREKREYDAGHVKNAINIPLSEFRKRMGEIPKDVPVYLYCRTGQRSYNALMALKNSGYENACNISGSYLGICFYEYYRDQVEDREKIVTQYSFQ